MVTMAFAATCGSLVSNLIGAGEIKCVLERSASTSVSVIFSCCRWLYSSHCFPNLILSIYMIFPIWRPPSLFLWVLCLGLSDTRTCQRLFSGSIRNGNTYGVGTWCTGHLSDLYHLYDSLSERDVAVCWTTEHLYGICILFLSYLYIKKGNWQKKQI